MTAFAAGAIVALALALAFTLRALTAARRALGRAEARAKALEAENASIAAQRDAALAGPRDAHDLIGRLRDPGRRV